MTQPRPETKSLRPDLVISFALLLTGLIGRLMMLSLTEYPMGDGGMFYVMVQDLQKNNFVLPETTTYNQLQIPYAYPPLGFYLAALLTWLGADLFAVLKWLPILMRTAALAWVYLFGRQYFRGATGGLITLGFFVFESQNVFWNWTGGGLTRSLGQFCSLAVLYFVNKHTVDGKPRSLVLGAVFTALAIFSHPDSAVLSLMSSYLLLVFFLKHNRLGTFAAYAGLSILLSSPYWLFMILRHGPGTFTAAFLSGVSGQFSMTNLLQWSALILVGTVPLYWSRLANALKGRLSYPGSTPLSFFYSCGCL